MKPHFVILALSVGSGIFATTGHAAETMRGKCTAEIKKFACDAISESYAYDCLSKHAERRVKDKGFSQKCYKAYASFEKETGRGERLESHQVEQREHTN